MGQKRTSPRADKGAQPPPAKKKAAALTEPAPIGAAADDPATPPGTDAPGQEAWRTNLRGGAHPLLARPRPEEWWTGLPPAACEGLAGPPVARKAPAELTSLPLPNLARLTREGVKEYFDNTWTLTEVLFSSLLGEEPFYCPPYHQLRHPLVFYYAHPAALYVNKLRVAGVLKEPLNQYFETIFETGVDEMRWDDMSKNEMQWPAIEEVHAYRKQVYALVNDVISTHPGLAPGAPPVTQDDPLWALFMGFEHERIHLETSSVLMRELPLRLVARPVNWPADHPSVAARNPAPANPLVAVPAGDVTLGKPRDWPSYGWDNEYGSRTMHVRAFEASAGLVSNGEFLEFVKCGGYATRAFWSEDGWRWRTFRNAKWPTFWVPDGPAGLHQYRLRLPFEVVDMPPALPAEVNVHEARAFCAWRAKREGMPEGSYRITSEPEHHRMRGTALPSQPGDDAVMVKSGAMLRGTANANLAWGSGSATNAHAPSPSGFYDTFGSAWEWCEDWFAALPGFQLHPFYDDFSTPCFDGEHSVIMGGSFASTGDEASAFARFHFRSHFFQHAGFRVVRASHLLTSCTDAPPPHAAGWVPRSADPSRQNAAADASEAGNALARDLLAAFGAPEEVLPREAERALLAPALGFADRCADALRAAAGERNVPLFRVLDVGSGVGALSFALARGGSGSVLGVEQSAAHVATAEDLRRGKAVTYERRDHGAERTGLSAIAGIPAADLARVAFRQMDPCCLSPDLGAFDAVVVNMILDRVTSPKAVLGRMGGALGLVRPGGLLLVVCAYDWQENCTPKPSWIAPGDLGAALGPAFESVPNEQLDVPHLRRHYGRGFELKLAQASVWQRSE